MIWRFSLEGHDIRRGLFERNLTISILVFVLALSVLLSGVFSSDVLSKVGFSEAEKTRAISLIDSVHATTQPAVVHSLIDSLLPLARAAEDTTFILPLLLRKGFEYTAFGDGVRGELTLRKVAELAAACEDSSQLSTTLRWLGMAVSFQGRYAETEEIYIELCELAQSIGHRSNEAWGYFGLAWIAERFGRFDTSMKEYQRAASIFREIEETRGEISALNGLGIVQDAVGNLSAAWETYNRVANLSREHGFLSLEGSALNNIGTLQYSWGDPGLAEEYFERASTLQREARIPREAIISSHNVCDCLILLGRHSRAVAQLESLLVECRALRYADLEIMNLNSLASVHLEQGHYRTAAMLFRKGINPSMSFPLNYRIDSYRGLGEALANMDSSFAGLAVLNRALGEPEIARTKSKKLILIGDFGARLLEMEHYEEHILRISPALADAEALGMLPLQIDLSTQLARAHRAMGRPDSAMIHLQNAAEAWKSVREVPVDPEWREQHGELGRLLYVQLAELLLSDGSGVPLEERKEAAFNTLQVFKSRTLLERMLGPGGNQTSLSPEENVRPEEDVRLVTLTEVQMELLKDEELFLDTYVGPETSLLFAITKDECRIVNFSAGKDLQELITCYRELLASAEEATNPLGSASARRSVRHDLVSELTMGIEDLIEKSRRVLIAPDGPLNLIPFSALFYRAQTDPIPGNNVEDLQCVRVPSATILAHLRRNLRSDFRNNLFTENQDGDCDSLPSRILAVAHGAIESGRAIPGTLREVKTLHSRYMDVDLRILGPQTSGSWTEDLFQYDLLHMAAHVEINNDAPWQSEILFGDRREPGNLRASQIAEMNLPARLVVLSSCESAGGRILAGEGVLGLTSAFLSAGVSSVVATLWPVDDNATESFMGALYGYVEKRYSVGHALELSRKVLRDQPETSHPFYWAGFTLVGDGDVVLNLKKKRNFSPVILLIILMLVAIVTLLFVRKCRCA